MTAPEIPRDGHRPAQYSPPVSEVMRHEMRGALATQWLREGAVEFKVSWAVVEAEVDRRQRGRGGTWHAAALELLLDLHAGLWAP